MDIDFDALLDDEDSSPINPREIFQTLDKDPAFTFLRNVQSDVLDRWFTDRTNRDSVIKLNVGSGKTTVGLLALQSCLNEGVYPAVFACPDNLLVEQVADEAKRLGINITSEPRNADVRSGRTILVTNIHRVFNGKSVFGVGKMGERIPIGAIIIDDAHACLKTLEKQFRLTLPAQHPVYAWALKKFGDALQQQSPNSFGRVKLGERSEYVEVPFWSLRDHAHELLTELLQHEQTDEQIGFTLPFLGDHLPLCRVVIGGDQMEIAASHPWTDLINSFRQAKRRIYMTATLADDTILVTHLGADPAELGEAITTPSVTMGERMILMPQELNPDLTLAEVKPMLAGFALEHNVVVIVPSEQASKDWTDVAHQILIGDAVVDGVARLRTSHVGLTVLVNRYDGIDLPEGACRVLAIVGLPEASSLIERADITVLNEAGVTLRRQIQRIEQGMGRGVRSADDHCAVILFGSALTERLLSAEGKSMLTAATTAQLDLSLRLAKQMGRATPADIASVVGKCLQRDANWRKSARQILLKAVDQTALRIDEGQVALRSAVDHARDGDHRRAAAILAGAVNAENEPSTKAWLSARLAHLTDFFDRSDAQRTLKAAHKLNRSVLRPADGASYEPLAVEMAAQAASSQRYLRYRRLEAPERILFANRLNEDLIWKKGTHLSFEQALKDLGDVIGVLSQRPEREFEEGPDNLWKIPNGPFLVIECKNGSEATDGIAKGDLGQLAQALEWFTQRYGANEQRVPVIIHPLSHVGPQASAIPGCRVIDGHRLRLLKEAFVSYVRSVAPEDVISDVAQVEKALIDHNLIGGRFLEAFTVAL